MNIRYGINSILIKVGFNSSVPQNSREGMMIQVPIKKEMMMKI